MKPFTDNRNSLLFTNPGSHGPDIIWRDNTAEHEQSRLLECADDNFLLQMIEEPVMRGAVLDLLLVNKEELLGNVKLKHSPGCSGCEMVLDVLWHFLFHSIEGMSLSSKICASLSQIQEQRVF